MFLTACLLFTGRWLQITGAPIMARNFQIRNYHPADREAVRRLCCETGFLGKPDRSRF